MYKIQTTFESGSGTGCQMVVRILDYHLNTRHLNTRLVKVNYSAAFIFQMFVFQIPTVSIVYNSFQGFDKLNFLNIIKQYMFKYQLTSF